ncbi:hypothetical protein KY284_026822 [Solanum tuberosum]|nr:hypothetical protein KY284_026822 [Solanum tuberosum]
MDKHWWIKSSTGKFTVKSAWEIFRSRDEVSENFKRIWVKGLPFKISFFGWRVWTYRVPVADIISSWNPNISPLCQCCKVPIRETIEHLFLLGEVATYIWDHYVRAAGILGPWIQVKYTMKKWWVAQGWLKCNTDGDSRGNPGLSASAFCLRNHKGKFLGAKGMKIIDSTTLVVHINLSQIKMFLVKAGKNYHMDKGNTPYIRTKQISSSTQ